MDSQRRSHPERCVIGRHPRSKRRGLIRQPLARKRAGMPIFGRAKMIAKRVLGGEWQRKNRLQLKRVSNDNGTPRSPDGTDGGLRSGLPCFIDKEPADGLAIMKWKQSVHRRKRRRYYWDKEKEGIPCRLHGLRGHTSGEVAEKDIGQSHKVLTDLGCARMKECMMKPQGGKEDLCAGQAPFPIHPRRGVFPLRLIVCPIRAEWKVFTQDLACLIDLPSYKRELRLDLCQSLLAVTVCLLHLCMPLICRRNSFLSIRGAPLRGDDPSLIFQIRFSPLAIRLS